MKIGGLSKLKTFHQDIPKCHIILILERERVTSASDTSHCRAECQNIAIAAVWKEKEAPEDGYT